jgi:hypothetical protein
VAWRRSVALLQAREEEEEDKGEENLRRKSVAVMRSASNGFHGGLFKNNKFKFFKKKTALCLCVSLLV